MSLKSPLAAAFLLFAQPPQEPRAPDPPWFSSAAHDAGRRLEGSVVTHLFPFRNPHAEPRVIRWMQKTCDCAAAFLILSGKEIPADSVREAPVTIPPGGQGGVKLVLSVTECGPLVGTATLGFGDAEDSPHSVKLSVLGEGHFQVTPPVLALGELLAGESQAFSFRIESAYLEHWTITGIDPLPPGLRLLDPERIEAGGRVIYTVRGTLGPDLTPGRAGGVIRLRTDAVSRPIEIRVGAEVKAPYSVSPPGFLHFGLVRRAQGSPPRTIRIETRDPGHDLKLIDVRLEGLNRPSRWIGIERLEPSRPGRYEVQVAILPGAPPGELRGRLLLVLSHPRAPRHVVEFSAMVR